MSAEEIVKSRVHMLHKAARKFPGRQIVVSGIIPRGDKLDEQIPDINYDIHEQVKTIPSTVSYRHIMAIYAMVECTMTTNN